MGLTLEEHKKRHIELHKSLDELFADYISHHPDQVGFTTMPIKQLIEWSHRQTVKPDEENLNCSGEKTEVTC